MAPDWGADSSTLHENLVQALCLARDQARTRKTPELENAKQWHRHIMENLAVPDKNYIGRFRGEEGLENYEVQIGPHPGVSVIDIVDELTQFEGRLKNAIDILDELIPVNEIPDANTFNAVIDVCAWVHSEWVRIHPFANGNGRTARIWANYVAMRFGLPPFIRLRPRPEGEQYERVSYLAMTGEWKPTIVLFRNMFERFVNEET